MAIERSNRRVAATRIVAIARQLLESSTLCAIATVTGNGAAHVNSAYFAFDRDFKVVWLSEPQALHSRNLRANHSAAIAVYDSGQSWGRPDRGVQLSGTAREAADEDAERAEALYARRFSAYTKTDLGGYRFTTLFVDPPRCGLDEATLALARRFDRILHISCNPHTLRDNVAALQPTHRIAAAAAFDQFPYTQHLECGVVLARR